MSIRSRQLNCSAFIKWNTIQQSKQINDSLTDHRCISKTMLSENTSNFDFEQVDVFIYSSQTKIVPLGVVVSIKWKDSYQVFTKHMA